jgi:methyl-accepting chemotaxis protein
MSESERSNGAASPNNTSKRPQSHQRKLRNYLLDKKFQLKYTGIVVAVTAVLSGVLGYYLHQEIVVSQDTILARDLGVDTHVIEPGDVAKLQQVSQQIDREFNDALTTKLSVIVTINNAPAGGTADLYEASFDEELSRKSTVLIAALLVFLIVLAVIWVYLTHRIAGPVFKLKLLFSKISGDHIVIEGRLRKGDELQEAFDSFQQMIERIRNDRERKAERISKALEGLKAGDPVSDEDIEALKSIRDEMVDSLRD